MSQIIPCGSSSVQPSPDRHTDPAAWTEWALARAAALAAERRRFGPPIPALDDAPPAEREPGYLDVPCADLDWWDQVTRSEWWADLERDDAAEFYGGEQFTCEPAFSGDAYERESYEAAEVERHFRPRSRSTRVDAEQEARLYGYGR